MGNYGVREKEETFISSMYSINVDFDCLAKASTIWPSEGRSYKS